MAPIFFDPEKFHQVWGDELKAGTANRDADRGQLQISAGGMVAIGDEFVGERSSKSSIWLRPNIAVRRRNGRPGQELLQHHLPEIWIRR